MKNQRFVAFVPGNNEYFMYKYTQIRPKRYEKTGQHINLRFKGFYSKKDIYIEKLKKIPHIENIGRKFKPQSNGNIDERQRGAS